MYKSFVDQIEEAVEKGEQIDRTNVIPFRTNPYMQLESLALDVHIRNLLNTYGLDQLEKSFDKIKKAG